ncbi:MAG: type II toxin-antitoxin system RelE family toxin [Paracoccaceae bacterium]
MKQVFYQPAAATALRRMPRNTALRIRSKINAYAEDPASQRNNVTRLRGMDAIRLRVGDWRIIMVETEVIEVLRIGPRGNVYED